MPTPLLCALLLTAPAPLPQVTEEPPRPHVVVFLADDLGWNGVGYHGGRVRTPVLDALATGGARLEAFYTQPLCTPARAALLTGRYPIRMGLQFGVMRPWDEGGLPLEERLLPEVLRDAGYETALVGKWHLGHARPEYLPTRRGFEHQYGCFTGWVDYVDHDREGVFDWNRDDEPVNERGHVTDLLARECERLIRERDGERPLFLYVPFTAPHGPFKLPQGFRKGYEDVQDEDLRDYYRMITHLDDAIGRVLAVLDEEGLREDTLVVFASDNGGQKEVGPPANRPLRGQKGTVYEGGVRVPAIVSWPGRVEPGLVIEEPLHVVDLFPTLAGLAGASLEETLPLDGRDVWPVLAEGATGVREDLLINSNHAVGAVRAGRWKLVSWRKQGIANRRQLFDLAADPAEEEDLSRQHPGEVARLEAILARYDRGSLPELEARDSSKPPKDFEFPWRWGHEKRKRAKGKDRSSDRR
jgi:arylsulfatase A-like enzyme